MAPLILHNVPDEELYTGEDGVQRPYAMIFPGTDGHSTSLRRKNLPETGSFGKSTRRSRSKTATPATRREDPTLLASDAIFSQFLSQQPAPPSETALQRKTSSGSQKALAQLPASTTTNKDAGAAGSTRYVQRIPTEVILGGFGESHAYAAIKHYEQIGGYICEDYPRDPPLEQRKYKSDLRDPTTLRKRALTPEEKAKALHFAGGEHWIKVTFESAEAAEAAIYASPQLILGHQVYAELYRGPPSSDEPILASTAGRTVGRHTRQGSRSGFGSSSAFSPRRPSSTLPRTFTPGPSEPTQQNLSSSPSGSHTSSSTLDTATLSTITGTTTSSATVIAPPEDNMYCKRIPTVKRAQLLPAEQALLPQRTLTQRVAKHVPIVKSFNTDIIGSQVPRTEMGDFDWVKASLYWRIMWLLDFYLRFFGGDIVGNEKDE